MVEITDEESARAWFKGQPREVCVALAARAALRAAPIIAFRLDEPLGEVALPFFRTMLTPAVVGNRPTADIQFPLSTAFDTAYHNARTALRDSPFRDDLSEIAPILTPALEIDVFAADTSARSALWSGAYVEPLAQSAAFAGLSADCTEIDRESGTPIFERPLWHHTTEPDTGAQVGADEPPDMAAARHRLLGFFDQDPATWGFWKRWYEGLFHGTWRDWDLCRDIALIPNAVWEQGPEAVAREIAKLEAKQEMLRRIDELEDLLAQSRSGRFGIGGNNPPPEEALPNSAIEPQQQAQFDALTARLDQIETGIAELKAEADKPEPDKEKVRSWGQWLLDLGSDCAQYCASVADIVIKSAATQAGKYFWFYLLAQTDALHTLVTAIGKLTLTLAGLL